MGFVHLNQICWIWPTAFGSASEVEARQLHTLPASAFLEGSSEVRQVREVLGPPASALGLPRPRQAPSSVLAVLAVLAPQLRPKFFGPQGAGSSR